MRHLECIGVPPPAESLENPVSWGWGNCSCITNLLESISTTTKDVFLSADVGGFRFEEFDGGGNGFYEFSES